MTVFRTRSAGSAPALIGKTLGWGAFLAGLAVAAIGIGTLRVEFAVGGLIAALTSGLILLRMRAEALGRMDSTGETSDAQPMISSPAA